MSHNAELSVDQQIKYIESFLMYDIKEMEILNPFIGLSNGALLKEVRKSLIELKSLKEVK